MAYNFGDEEETNTGEADKIDFDVVDFNIEPTDKLLETSQDQGNVEIDWGDLDDLNTNETPADVIDFDIDMDALKNEISVEDAGVYIPTDGVAKDNDAFSLIEWTETRNLLINDLVKVNPRIFTGPNLLTIPGKLRKYF